MAGKVSLAEYSFDITVNNSNVNKGFKEAEKQADTSANNILKTFNENSQKMTESLSGLNILANGLNNLGKGLTLGITTPFIGLGAAATNLASDLNESLNKVQVAFKDNSKTVEEWSKTTLSKFGIAQGTALDMSATFGDMATSMGLSTGEASDMAMSLTGLAGDLSSFKNIGVDQAMTALNGVFTGETESLKSLGIVMTQTNLDAFALANGFGKTTKEMTEAEKVNLRYQYVMNATKNAQGDFANTADGTANSIRVFKESLKQLGATLGQHILPIITPVIQKFTEIVTKIANLDAETQKMIMKIGLVAASVGPLLIVVSKVISVFTKVKGAIAGVQGVLALLGTSLTGILVPIGLVVAGVAGFAYAWKTNFGGIRDTTLEIFEAVKTIVTNVLSAIKNAWDTNFYGIRDIANSVLPFIKQLFNTVFTALAEIAKVVLSVLKGDWEGAWNGILTFSSNLWENMKNLFAKFLDIILNILFSIGTSLYDASKYVFGKVKEGFTTMWNAIKEWFKKAANDPVNTLKNIGSACFNAGKSVFTAIWDGMKSIWNDISNWVSSKINWLKDKLTFWNNSKRSMSSRSNESYGRYNSYAIGNNQLRTEGLAYLHKGEMVMPRDYNPFNSNKLSKELANQLVGLGLGNTTYNIDVHDINDLDRISKFLDRHIPENYDRYFKRGTKRYLDSLGIKTR